MTITPYTDPALEHLAAYIADGLNAKQSGMVRRWVVSEMLSYRVEEYPLLQLQCLEATGEQLQNCSGSIRYCLINQQIQVGNEQQLGFRYATKAIAQLLRKYAWEQDFNDYPCIVKDLKNLKADTRTGPLKAADGGSIAQVTWGEVFFTYGDREEVE